VVEESSFQLGVSMHWHRNVSAFSLFAVDVMAAVNSQQNPSEPLERFG
jgi:hypothetical protein